MEWYIFTYIVWRVASVSMHSEVNAFQLSVLKAYVKIVFKLHLKHHIFVSPTLDLFSYFCIFSFCHVRELEFPAVSGNSAWLFTENIFRGKQHIISCQHFVCACKGFCLSGNNYNQSYQMFGSGCQTSA